MKTRACEQRLEDKKQKSKEPSYSSRIMGDFFPFFKKLCIILVCHFLRIALLIKGSSFFSKANIYAMESLYKEKGKESML